MDPLTASDHPDPRKVSIGGGLIHWPQVSKARVPHPSRSGRVGCTTFGVRTVTLFESVILSERRTSVFLPPQPAGCRVPHPSAKREGGMYDLRRAPPSPSLKVSS
jgi:hypothetical protein